MTDVYVCRSCGSDEVFETFVLTNPNTGDDECFEPPLQWCKTCSAHCLIDTIEREEEEEEEEG